jgi:hypothetical protein
MHPIMNKAIIFIFKKAIILFIFIFKKVIILFIFIFKKVIINIIIYLLIYAPYPPLD